MQDQISIQAIFLLGNVGKMESGNPMRLQLTYHDERVHISGYVEQGSQQFGLITIHVNLPSTHSAGKVEDRLTFGIPKTDDESQTLVYQWKGDIEYFRPGRWIAYLQQLVEQQNQKNVELMQLNQQPIDDSALFPEISTE